MVHTSIREKDQQDAHFFSLIYSNYLFTSNHIVLPARHSIDAWQNTSGCVYRNNLLMMNNCLFETCGGYFTEAIPLCDNTIVYTIVLSHNRMASVKSIASQARAIFQYKNTRIKVLKCCANISILFYLHWWCTVKHKSSWYFYMNKKEFICHLKLQLYIIVIVKTTYQDLINFEKKSLFHAPNHLYKRKFLVSFKALFSISVSKCINDTFSSWQVFFFPT